MAPFNLRIKVPISGSVQQPVPDNVIFLDLHLALSNAHVSTPKEFLKNGVTLCHLPLFNTPLF